MKSGENEKVEAEIKRDGEDNLSGCSAAHSWQRGDGGIKFNNQPINLTWSWHEQDCWLQYSVTKDSTYRGHLLNRKHHTTPQMIWKHLVQSSIPYVSVFYNLILLLHNNEH